jgi:hypothetical protein
MVRKEAAVEDEDASQQAKLDLQNLIVTNSPSYFIYFNNN